MPENSDWISCSGCENSRSSGEKPNFDPKPQKTRNDSSYQFKAKIRDYPSGLEPDFKSRKAFIYLSYYTLTSQPLTSILLSPHGLRGQNECHLSTSVLGNISTSLLALSVYGNISNLSLECIPYF